MVEVGDLYLVGEDCSSLLTSEPEVEVMDGPPGVAVAIKPAMVVPDGPDCETSVLGGKMLITARDIDVYSYSRMVLRITYKLQTAIYSEVSTSTSRSFREAHTYGDDHALSVELNRSSNFPSRCLRPWWERRGRSDNPNPCAEHRIEKR